MTRLTDRQKRLYDNLMVVFKKDNERSEWNRVYDVSTFEEFIGLGAIAWFDVMLNVGYSCRYVDEMINQSPRFNKLFDKILDYYNENK